MKKIFSLTILSVLLMVFSFGKLNAQVTIGADVEPQPFSVLELMGQYETGVFGGLRLPQLSSGQRDALIPTLTTPTQKKKVFSILVLRVTAFLLTRNGRVYLTLNF